MCGRRCRWRTGPPPSGTPAARRPAAPTRPAVGAQQEQSLEVRPQRRPQRLAICVRLAASTGPAGASCFRRASRERRICVGCRGRDMEGSANGGAALIGIQTYQKRAKKQAVRRKKLLPTRQACSNSILGKDFRTAQGAKNSLFLRAGSGLSSLAVTSATWARSFAGTWVNRCQRSTSRRASIPSQWPAPCRSAR